MRILHLNPYFFPYRGGIERRIWGLSKELVKSGHELVVLTSQLPDTAPEEKVDGILVRRLESKFYDIANYNPPFLTTKGIAEAIRDIEPDVIDFHYRWAPDYTRSVRKVRRDIPVAFTFHNTFGEGEGLEGRISYLSDSIFKWFLRQCDLVICVSDFIRRDLERRRIPPGKLRVSHNGIDPTPEAEIARLRAAAPAGAPYAVFVGRLVRTKGLSVLVEAAREVRQPLRFVICGQGPEAEGLAGQAADFGVADRFDFRGFTGEAAKRELLAGARLLVHPATFESFGIAVLEALDLACPVVATAVGGLPEVVGDAGVLVRPGDPKALAAAVDLVAGGGAERDRLARAARAQAAKFAWPKLAAQVEQIYLEAARGRARAA
ncbi:MAG TPA: glycosyltransferase family 4 protein [Candidatus Thermoplasmatota archaeon]